MTDFPDYQEPAANAAALSTTNLTGTGLAKETGGNLATHTALLSGAQAGALVGGPGRTVGQEVAALIATGSAAGVPGGAPLLHGHDQLFTVTGQVIPVSGVYSPADIVFTRPGYVIRILALMSAAGSVMPSQQVTLTFRSSASGSAVVDQVIWFVPAGGTTSQRTMLKGPMMGDTLSITVTNGDAANTCTITLAVYETTQAPVRHDGRSSSAVGWSGGTAAPSNAGSLILANDSFNVPAGQTVSKSLPLYAGQVNVFINQNAGAGAVMQIAPYGNFLVAAQAPLANLNWSAGPFTYVGIILPRAWCVMSFINPGAAAAIATYSITAQEYAS